jgi:hypothetical protein
MVTLNAGGSGEPSTSSHSTARSMVAKGHNALHRRRRAKGTVAGYGNYKAPGNNAVDSSTSAIQSASPSDTKVGGGSVEMTDATTPPVSTGTSTTPGSPAGNQPQHNNEAPTKPCHSARMSVLCCQNAIRMGARTQLGLCPPGRPRRSLQAALRQRTRASSSALSHPAQSSGNSSNRRLSVGSTDPGGYYVLEKMIGTESLNDYEDQEEDYLLSTNTFDVESDEEASSGDEDDISNIEMLLSPESAKLDDESKYVNLREPLFAPIGVENSLSNPNGAPSMSGMGSGASGKLPFNRRKIRYFDGITAQERQTARAYLQQEATKNRQRSALLLSRHLKRMQKEERRKRRQQKGESVDNDSPSDDENEDPKEKALLSGVSQFEQPMSASMSAALLLESLSINPVESIEGMAKCYDGIVSAGVALLDSQIADPTSPATNVDEKERPRASRADVLAALAPLLITSLEQPSGDVMLLLSRMRRMCGTPRYQRRFVQRVAPCLVRPKGAAVWCLRHQHDMEPIVAAVELILDSAHEIFSKGWYEKGQLYLADSKRAETLNSAAAQLRNLSADTSSEGLSLGLTNHSHGMRRYMSGSQKDQKASEHMAEWEVMAVDREIRLSISKIMSSDWNRVNLNVKDSDSVRSFRRSMSTSTNKRPGVLPSSSSAEAPSPRAMITSPRSPPRPLSVKTPLSPPVPTPPTPSETFEKAFDTPPVQPPSPAERPTSPDQALVQKNGAAMAVSPPTSQRQVQDVEGESKTIPIVNSTPPRSPKSPMRDAVEQAPPAAKSNASATPFTPLSPRRNKAPSPPSNQNIKDAPESMPTSIAPFAPSLGGSAAPLSPSSIGTSSTAELVSYRPSSGSSILSSVSGASQTAHYRTLTSTASERKRTVAACRALRAQITRFEDAFIQIHGRPPKGAAERAPLATTYSQYREWKRAIRADAACRIQALFRGARTRWILMRSEEPRMSRIVMSRAGRAEFAFQSGERAAGPSANQENLLKQIGIPVEIGESDSSRVAPLKPSSSSSLGSLQSHGSDAFRGQHGVTQSLAPQWASQVVRRRAGSGERSHEGFPSTTTLKPQTGAAPPSSPNASLADIKSLSLPELQAKKRELKQQLKQYDMNFARKHGRMPVKAEKEPIRHLYEQYNALKSQIATLEQESARPHHAAVIPQSAPALVPQQQPRVIAAPPTPPDSSESDRSIDSPGNVGFMGSRGKRKNMRSPPTATTSTPPGAPSQDLAALKAEKGRLHQMLRSYEKDFFKEHKRQVSSFADIKPVASDYRRYKEIKKAIASLQQSGGER